MAQYSIFHFCNELRDEVSIWGRNQGASQSESICPALNFSGWTIQLMGEKGGWPGTGGRGEWEGVSLLVSWPPRIFIPVWVNPNWQDPPLPRTMPLLLTFLCFAGGKLALAPQTESLINSNIQEPHADYEWRVVKSGERARGKKGRRWLIQTVRTLCVSHPKELLL